MGAPSRQRVSVQSDRKMVTLRGAVVPVTGEPTTLYGWAYPPLASVMCVLLDDGRELLIARKDLKAADAVTTAMPIADAAPDTQRDVSTWFAAEVA